MPQTRTIFFFFFWNKRISKQNWKIGPNTKTFRLIHQKTRERSKKTSSQGWNQNRIPDLKKQLLCKKFKNSNSGLPNIDLTTKSNSKCLLNRRGSAQTAAENSNRPHKKTTSQGPVVDRETRTFFQHAPFKQHIIKHCEPQHTDLESSHPHQPQTTTKKKQKRFQIHTRPKKKVGLRENPHHRTIKNNTTKKKLANFTHRDQRLPLPKPVRAVRSNGSKTATFGDLRVGNCRDSNAAGGGGGCAAGRGVGVGFRRWIWEVRRRRWSLGRKGWGRRSLAGKRWCDGKWSFYVCSPKESIYIKNI